MTAHRDTGRYEVTWDGDEACQQLRLRVTLHVPEQLNDARPAPQDVLAHLRDELFALGHGFTVLRGEGVGEGSVGVCREPIMLYVVDVPVDVPMSVVRSIAEDIRHALGQHVLYVTITPISVLEVRAPHMATELVHA